MLDFEKMRLKNWKFTKKTFCALKITRLTSAHFRKQFFSTLWHFLYSINKKLNFRNESQRVKNANKPLVVKKRKFQNYWKIIKFFSSGNFYRRFRIWAQNWQKFFNLTRERQFVHFLHFREDSSDHSQTIPDYRGRHLHQKSRKKIGNIYGLTAKNDNLDLQNYQNFKNHQNFLNCRWHIYLVFLG